MTTASNWFVFTKSKVKSDERESNTRGASAGVRDILIFLLIKKLKDQRVIPIKVIKRKRNCLLMLKKFTVIGRKNKGTAKMQKTKRDWISERRRLFFSISSLYLNMQENPSSKNKSSILS